MADERDPEVSQRYRSLGSEEPSRELDQSILAAAHRAADRAHAPLVTPAGRHRWYFAFGAAAVLVLAVAVTVHVERERPDPEAVVLNQQVPKEQVPQQAAPASEPPAAATKPPAPQRRSGITADPAPKIQQNPPEAARDAAGAASASAESRLRENAPGSVARVDEAAKAPAPPSAAARRAGESADSVRSPRLEARQSAPAVAAYVDSPERFLERIAQLRNEGRHDDADKALAEFRQRYPDYRISGEMRQKVEREK
jgi:hypothetical protein